MINGNKTASFVGTKGYHDKKSGLINNQETKLYGTYDSSSNKPPRAPGTASSGQLSEAGSRFKQRRRTQGNTQERRKSSVEAHHDEKSGAGGGPRNLSSLSMAGK